MHLTSSMKGKVNDPLTYVTESTRRGYRNSILKKALFLIVLGVCVLALDLIIFGRTGQGFSGGLRLDPSVTSRINRYREGTSLITTLIEFGAPSCGVYMLATMRRRMRKLAIHDLAAFNPELVRQSTAEESDVGDRISRVISVLGSVLMRIIIVVIAIFVLFVLGAVVVLGIRRG